MKIQVDRDSVCMGDDVLPHETEFDVPEDMTVKDFFGFLEKGRYLPSVQGNNVAWELRNRNGEQGVYFTKTGEIIHLDAVLKETLRGMNEPPLFVLLYHSTPEAYYISKENR
ncbi:hypothetical protein [Streptococcus sp. ST16]|uniref:hypothetical protein n=1 Tax=Streptococcus sp. ST16 TaxID=3378283 RepID=UPI0038D4D39F